MLQPHRYLASVCLTSWPLSAAIAALWAVAGPTALQGQEGVASLLPRIAEKRVIGPTTIVAEANSELDFKARVDTGAASTSVHVEEWAIEDESPNMEENIGKKIRFRIQNHRGESQWLESRIEAIGLVKTSEEQEERYKVELTLCLDDVRKKVLVTLNDRSHMEYPLLLGRNFLEDDFLVDVGLEQQSEDTPTKQTAAEPGEKAPQG
jgi:hypothetical protein